MTRQPGLTLSDIAGMSEDVPVGGSYITVHGISAKTVATIIQRFPKLASMLGGFRASDFVEAAPDAVAAIIAAAVDHRRSNIATFDAEAEENAGNVPVEVQYDLLEAIGRLTFKNGFGPFVKRVMAAA